MRAFGSGPRQLSGEHLHKQPHPRPRKTRRENRPHRLDHSSMMQRDRWFKSAEMASDGADCSQLVALGHGAEIRDICRQNGRQSLFQEHLHLPHPSKQKHRKLGKANFSLLGSPTGRKLRGTPRRHKTGAEPQGLRRNRVWRQLQNAPPHRAGRCRIELTSEPSGLRHQGGWFRRSTSGW